MTKSWIQQVDQRAGRNARKPYFAPMYILAGMAFVGFGLINDTYSFYLVGLGIALGALGLMSLWARRPARR